MVWAGLPSNPGLMTVRRTALKPGVRRRDTLLETGRKGNCRAGFLRESVIKPVGGDPAGRKPGNKYHNLTLFPSSVSSPAGASSGLTNQKQCKGGWGNSLQRTEWKGMESGSIRARKRCPAQTLHLQSLCAKNTRVQNCFYP